MRAAAACDRIWPIGEITHPTRKIGHPKSVVLSYLNRLNKFELHTLTVYINYFKYFELHLLLALTILTIKHKFSPVDPDPEQLLDYIHNHGSSK